MKYSLHQLQNIETIISEGSMNKAAKRLGVSQPAISRSLQALEETLGFNLFYRDKQKLVLTQEGKKIVHEMENLLQSATRFEESIELLKRGQKAVRIGNPSGLSVRFLPDIINHYQQLEKDFDIRLETRSSPALCSDIGQNDLDVAIVSTSFSNSSALYCEEILSTELVCIVPAAHPLAEYEKLTLEDIQKQKIIFPSRLDLAGNWVSDINTPLFNNAKITANIAAIAGLVANGLGISVINCLSAFEMSNQEEIKIIPFAPEHQFVFYLVYRKDWAENHDILQFKHAIKMIVQLRQQQMGELGSRISYLGD